MAPKDKDHKLQKSGLIYKFTCPYINYAEQYIGESGRTLGDRIKEHLRVPSSIHQHSNTTGHPVSPDCFTIIHRESQGNTRNIKEAMFILVNDPSLNRDIGKYSCHTFGIQYYRTLQLCTSSNTQHSPSPLSTLPLLGLLPQPFNSHPQWGAQISCW